MLFMKRIVSALISFLMLFSAAAPHTFGLPQKVGKNEIDMSKFVLTWQDEFDGTELNKDNWGFEWWVTERKGGYWHDDMVSVEDGNLVIRAEYKDEPLENAYYEKWHEQMMKVLPATDVGVVDFSLKYYHQLDESVLNSCLAFFPGAPRVAENFRLDKSQEERFIHFIGQPKPWQGWTPRAFRRFDSYVAVAEFAQSRNWRLPGPLPFSLKRENRTLCALLRYPVSWQYRIAKRLKKWFD